MANSDGRGGGKGKLSVSPIWGKSRPGGSGRLPAGGVAGAEPEGKGSRLGSGNGAEDADGAASRVATCVESPGGPDRFNSASRLAPMTMSPKGLEMAGAATVARAPAGEDGVGSSRTEPMQHPNANSPGERHSGRAGKDFKNPLRTIPALKRKVVECCVGSLHPPPYAYAWQLNQISAYALSLS